MGVAKPAGAKATSLLGSAWWSVTVPGASLVGLFYWNWQAFKNLGKRA